MSGNRSQAWGLYKSVFSVLLFVSSTNSFSMEFFSSYFSRSSRSCDASTQIDFDEADTREELQRMVAEELRTGGPGALVSVPAAIASEEHMLAPALTEEQKRHYICHGNTWEDMMSAYRDAPYDARVVVDHLTRPLDPAWRAAFFVGRPGTGKTTAALAIPHLARWYFDFVPSGPLLSRYRNETKEKLEAHLQRAVSSGKKVVVIIDEINRLLENFNSKKHDSDATSSALWMFLDSQKYNNNFFLIGTMNRDDKLPDPFKSRAVGSTVRFKMIPPNKLKEILKGKITSPTMELDPECDDTFMDRFVQLIQSEVIDISPRDYESMRFKIARLVRRDDPESEVHKIKQYHLYRAMCFIMKRYSQNRYGQEVLTEEEWRDFNAVQSRIIDVRLQCAQKVQMGVNVGVCAGVQFSRPPGLDMDEVIKILEQEFSDDQKALYMRVMKREFLIKRGFIDMVKQAVKSRAYKALQDIVMGPVLPIITFREVVRTIMGRGEPIRLPAADVRPLLTENRE